MKPRRSLIFAAVFAVALCLPLAAAKLLTEPTDLDALYRIKEEGLQAQRSKVMDTLSYLTDVYGPRLTASPNAQEAGDWTVKTLKEWGLSNVHTETFPFGRGWQNQRLSAMALTPRAYPLIVYPKAWTPGTNGPVTGQAVLAVIQNDQDLDAWKDKLRGKFVFTTALRNVPPQFDAPGHRFTDAELADLAKQPPAGLNRGGRGAPGPQAFQAQQQFQRKRSQFFVDEGVAALIDPGQDDGGTVVVQGPPNVSYDPKAPLQAPQVVMAIEHYGRIVRTLEKNLPVTLQLDIKNTFYDTNLNSFNIVADLPGTDKADEIVMLGAHFDSWHTGTGATDNAAGAAAMMEAMRILKQTGLKTRRTVRLGLWTGEEQGFFGSRAYVKEHYADRTTMQLRPDHGKFSVYFNLDNGTGAIRGVYLQGNEAAAPIFESWMEPFHNMGMSTVTIRNTGGTDHLAFDEVGLPGFQFVQDPIEYDTRTHHTNMDVYERVQPNDMMRNAVIIAAFAYDAANRDERLPRKPLPRPAQPPGRGAGH